MGTRRLSVLAYVAVVVVYLVVVQGVGLLLTRGRDIEYASASGVDSLWRGITVPVLASLVWVALVVTVLRWWRPCLADDRPVRSWVVVVPVVQLVAVVAVTNYGGLAERGLGLTALLLVSTLAVGFTEELMFRGLGVTVFRANGFTEGWVALWTTVIFGLAHATNLVSEGRSALVQVVAAALSGYFFYLVRRRTGGLLVPALVHGLWDFSLISATVVPGESCPLPVLSVLVIVALGVVVVVRRHRIEPA
ncbi:hypothetical protein BLA60_25965 [Actinophytocola xinjiangensis]|uniref:CAAX prenyl protease 2/Lysostaphin resistance protein A-like domain-containing protein n=1 Tax=Actinophytocola xinjiangensis TaxID=485602 RepID=A0A7Z0WJS1_9PSEU|nr:CPBP family intramembrane glutamic endopeptidase [Actinophytocola xinjiangensis]OLF07774.1 hypothetical protein BLA60_25965 [Actinophytocola xinjiangensis]